VSGTAQEGQAITCDSGAWSGAPAITYQWAWQRGNNDVVLLTGEQTGNTYPVQTADVGRQLFCYAIARNAGGNGRDLSATVTPTAAPAAVQPPPAPAAPKATPKDTTAPVARVARATCARTVCKLNVAVTDNGFTTGVRTVRVALRTRYKATCRKQGKSVACTKTRTRTLSAQLLGGSSYLVTASKLPAGSTNSFTLTAVDVAGNRQAKPTTKTLRTKKATSK
jgi:hypothetical protein